LGHRRLAVCDHVCQWVSALVDRHGARDIGQNALFGFLTFVPLANLWLLFSASAEKAAPQRLKMGFLLSGGMGVFLGLLGTGAGRALDTYTNEESTRRIAAADAAGVLDIVMLERSLGLNAAEVVLPMVVDEVTTLIKLEAEGKSLRYTYQLDQSVAELPYGFRNDMAQSVCTDSDLNRLIAAGAQLTFTYIAADQAELATVTVMQNDCTT
jgi:hypothetical protein